MVDVKIVQNFQPTLQLAVNNPQKNKGGRRPPRKNNVPKRKYTPLGEYLEYTLKKLVQARLITLPEVRNQETKIKPPWYKDNKYCEYHRLKGYKICNCFKLKELIQYLIDQVMLV